MNVGHVLKRGEEMAGSKQKSQIDAADALPRDRQGVRKSPRTVRIKGESIKLRVL